MTIRNRIATEEDYAELCRKMEAKYEAILNRVSKILTAMVVVMFIGAAAFTYTLWKQHDIAKKNEVNSVENRKAVNHLCTTSDSVATVLAAAADQITKNIANGTYDRLLKEGIIDEANITAAYATRAKYQKAVRDIKESGNPCDIIDPLQDERKATGVK